MKQGDVVKIEGRFAKIIAILRIDKKMYAQVEFLSGDKDKTK